jgi:hypothetical protein
VQGDRVLDDPADDQEQQQYGALVVLALRVDLAGVDRAVAAEADGVEAVDDLGRDSARPRNSPIRSLNDPSWRRPGRSGLVGLHRLG